jgi:hypothetical protein
VRTTLLCLAGLFAAAVAAGPALAQVKAGSETGTGLTGGEIPPLLKQIQADPYRPPAQPACQTVPSEIHEISKVIGPDFNSPTMPQTREEDYKERGAGVARSLIPYGGAFRAVSGADKKDKALREAVAAGVARRGFLRGISLNMTCNAPPPPAAASKPKAKARK